jgi:hypothetical protein
MSDQIVAISHQPLAIRNSQFAIRNSQFAPKLRGGSVTLLVLLAGSARAGIIPSDLVGLHRTARR